MKEILFYFRENRDYLHATTLFDHILKTCVSEEHKPKNIDFSTNKTTDKTCQILSSKENSDQDRLVGQYKDDKSSFFIYETDEKITDSIPYN